jgi:hypothetical protein
MLRAWEGTSGPFVCSVPTSGRKAVTFMQIVWGIVVAAVVVGLYLGIRSQMRKGQTLAGPITPDEIGVGTQVGEENPEYHAGESAAEATDEEFVDSGKTLGHG